MKLYRYTYIYIDLTVLLVEVKTIISYGNKPSYVVVRVYPPGRARWFFLVYFFDSIRSGRTLRELFSPVRDDDCRRSISWTFRIANRFNTLGTGHSENDANNILDVKLSSRKIVERFISWVIHTRVLRQCNSIG